MMRMTKFWSKRLRWKGIRYWKPLPKSKPKPANRWNIAMSNLVLGHWDPGDDARWQGEALFYEEDMIILVQQMQTGNNGVLRLDALNGADNLDLIAQGLMPEATTTSLPDAEITFVRARFNGDTWSFDVSLDHPDTGWEDYADRLACGNARWANSGDAHSAAPARW